MAIGLRTLPLAGSGSTPASAPIFSEYARPITRGLAAAVIATTTIGFVPPPVQAAVQPTPVFTKFSEPSFSRTFKAEQQPDVIFRILRPDAATPGPLVFHSFSQPPPITRLAAHLHTQPVFEVTRVILAVTPGPGIFPRFEQPAFSRTYPPWQQPSVSYALATPQPAAAVVVGGDFAKFDFLPKPSRAAQQDFTNAPQPPAVQNYVFAPFSQPLRVAPVKDGQINFEIGFLGPASTPDRLVFSEFAQPKFSTSYAYVEQPNPLFEELRPGDATPGPLSTFSSFGTPSKAKVPEGFTNAPQPAAVQNVVFGPFEQPQVKRAAQQDFVQFTINPPTVAAVVQPYVFLPFDLPVFKRAPQFDASVQFQIFPPTIVTVAVGGDFADFDFQPKPSRAAQQDFTNAPYFTPPVVAAVTFGGFSDFGKPTAPGKSAQQDFTNAPIAPFVQTYVFSPFEQPQFRKVAQYDPAVRFETGFLGPASTPPWFVFTPFDQPRFGPVIQGEHTSALFEVLRPDAATPGPGIFPAFEQPKFSTAFPPWQQPSVFFEIVQPPPPPASSGPVFSPFEQPQFYKITYQGDWVAFEIPFQGTTPPKAADGGGGKKKGIHHTGKHRWKKIKLIDELEELIAELNKLARLSPKEVVKAPTPVILARYPQALSDILGEIKQDHTAKALKASIAKAQIEAEYQLALQQQEDDDDAAFLLLM